MESLPARRLAALAADLSQRYRTGAPASGGRFARSREEIAAYAAVRLPATFGAVSAALTQVRARLPDWEPRSCLDVGAGPGTGMWAASAIWPELERITLIEREPEMRALGQRLARVAPLGAMAHARWRANDLNATWEAEPHDLVLAAYVLGEMPDAQRERLVGALWERACGMLVIVEPGTPAGFARVRQARDQLLAAGAAAIAPCPHDGSCPMAEGNWCHFAQRVARSRLHRQVKGGELSYEDEKFAFVGVARMRGTAIEGRVIRHPQVRPGHITIELCTPRGLTSTVVTRKERARFRQARALRWGSAVPAREGPDVEEQTTRET
jgi:ribosomal protein RSM22 (predicted rRNA methylase)